MSDPSRADTAPPGEEVSSPLSVAIEGRDRDTLAMVRRAVDARQVMLAFQPVMRCRNPDKVAFYEGLVRVLDHTGRIIPARDFIDAIELQELGRRLDALALELGLAALEREPSLRLAINMSARSIGYPRWMNVLKHGLERDPTIGERLILEITERTAIIIPEVVQVFMADMQSEGVVFALDDFGAGYTAFRYLRDFYFDILKIDGEFIRGIADTPDNQVIAQAMLSVARQFDMMTVAESVETLDDARFMAATGCDFMQGYFFGAPTVTPAWAAPTRRQGRRA
jgi:EAL domain-containing protein (putative c-di-GMP-specific phosphodiesterase class I)